MNSAIQVYHYKSAAADEESREYSGTLVLHVFVFFSPCVTGWMSEELIYLCESCSARLLSNTCSFSLGRKAKGERKNALREAGTDFVQDSSPRISTAFDSPDLLNLRDKTPARESSCQLSASVFEGMWTIRGSCSGRFTVEVRQHSSIARCHLLVNTHAHSLC